MSWTVSLANALGASESGVRLIFGQLSGYPLFLLHRMYLRNASASVQHLFFAVTGLFMAWWAIGMDAVFHSTLSILVTFAVLKLFRSSQLAAMLLFTFHIIYLFVGYVYNASRDYDITWTMPQCVICLRLIGLAMDCWDGTKPEEELSKDQKAAALKEIPNLLEFFSHSFFIGGYFVGPQFSMKKFQTFIIRNQEEPNLASPVSFGFKRFGIGVCYMVGHLIGSGYVPESWPMSKEFGQMDLLRRTFYFYVWVKVILAKYIAAWLFAEGACILSGLAYNGKDEKTGQIMWNGAANVKLRRFESCFKFQHLIDSFNINTNGWVFSYVYKRLRFLNNKLLSQFGVLFFLAVWHGYHSGYYITFFNEFIIMYVENQIVQLASHPSLASVTENPVVGVLAKVLGYFYVVTLLPHCFIAFALLKRDRYWPVIQTTNYFLWIYVLIGFLVVTGLKSVLKKPVQKRKE